MFKGILDFHLGVEWYWTGDNGCEFSSFHLNVTVILTILTHGPLFGEWTKEEKHVHFLKQLAGPFLKQACARGRPLFLILSV